MKHVSCLLAVVMLLMVFSQESFSIPAFARKYATSCQTCHNGFPKLNAFGEAFRRNGYQFPAGTDPEYTKQEAVSLGSDGNKKAFPDAIWPGSIPGSSPLSLFLNGEISYNPKVDPRFTFGGLGSDIEAVAGGTIGEDLSFWGQVAFSNEGVEINRMFLVFGNVIGDKYAFNLRAGAFEPGLFSFSVHRAWMEGYWITTQPFSDDMGWTVEEFQKGLEVNGMFGGRFGYNAGIVEGFGSLHSDKDFYAHLTYKIEGLPLDGVTEGGPALNNPQPYIDNSITLGTFAYHGIASLGEEPTTQGNGFTMAGGDINAYCDRFNLFGGVGIRHDEQPFLGTLGQSANTTVWFAEMDIVAFPWLLPGIRYESWKSESLDPDPQVTDLVQYTNSQFVPGIVALVRPNVKLTLRTTIEKFESRSDSKYDIGQVSLGLAVGI